ncbi:MAG: hypothetical protein ABI306_09320 [Caulobacteraceae bacterium]
MKSLIATGLAASAVAAGAGASAATCGCPPVRHHHHLHSAAVDHRATYRHEEPRAPRYAPAAYEAPPPVRYLAPAPVVAVAPPLAHYGPVYRQSVDYGFAPHGRAWGGWGGYRVGWRRGHGDRFEDSRRWARRDDGRRPERARG